MTNEIKILLFLKTVPRNFRFKTDVRGIRSSEMQNYALGLKGPTSATLV